jgi:hypothetical protein
VLDDIVFWYTSKDEIYKIGRWGKELRFGMENSEGDWMESR